MNRTGSYRWCDLDGYHGRVLKVDLTSGKTEVMEPDAALFRDNPRLRKAEIEEVQRRLVDFDHMIEDYYRERALDERGFARRERLEELGLGDVAEALESI